MAIHCNLHWPSCNDHCVPCRVEQGRRVLAVPVLHHVHIVMRFDLVASSLRLPHPLSAWLRARSALARLRALALCLAIRLLHDFLREVDGVARRFCVEDWIDVVSCSCTQATEDLARRVQPLSLGF